MLFDDRLAHPQLINSVANGFDCRLHRAVLQIVQILRLHGDVPHVARAGCGVVLRKPVLHQVAQIRTGLRPYALDHNLFGMAGGIRLCDLGVIDFSRTHARLQRLDCIIRVHIDGIVHLHLQDQVRATLEIESEVNPVLQR